MVRGMEIVEQAYPEWRSWFSVYASGALDLNEARPEIVSAVLGVDMRSAQILRRTRLGRDGLLNTQDDGMYKDVGQALIDLGSPNINPANVGVQSATKRLVIRVRVGDLTRELSAVIRGAIGQGATAILHMSETNPIQETP